MSNRGKAGVHVDVRNIVIPLWLGVSLTAGVCGMVATGCFAYWSVSTKVDILIVGQGETWTKTDQKLWCLETERANKGRWVCAGSGTVIAEPSPARRLSPAKKSAGFSLFGGE